MERLTISGTKEAKQNVTIREMLNKLTEYEDLEEQGLLLKLSWGEHTYPSEPKEIPFFDWLTGFLKKYCGGTVEELREAREKQRAKKPIRIDMCTCPNCGTYNEIVKKRRNTVSQDIVYCWHCGQAMEVKRGEEE